MPVIGLPPGPRTTPVIVPLNRMLTFAPLVVFADVTETGPVSCAVVVGALLVHDGSAARIWYLPAARLPTSYLPPPAEMVNAADAVVRITSDCPLIDPELVDETVEVFRNEHADYACNVSPRTYPRGLDTEVFSFDALDRAWLEAREAHQREHVTPYLYEHPQIFKLASLSGAADYSRYRWTLDTREDLELLRAIYSRFDGRDDFSWKEVLRLMESEPELAELNSQVLQKSVREH